MVDVRGVVDITLPFSQFSLFVQPDGSPFFRLEIRLAFFPFFPLRFWFGAVLTSSSVIFFFPCLLLSRNTQPISSILNVWRAQIQSASNRNRNLINITARSPQSATRQPPAPKPALPRGNALSSSLCQFCCWVSDARLHLIAITVSLNAI